MASQFYRLKVKDIRPETENCVSVAFDVPESLREAFSYKAGQYLTLRTQIDGEDVRRSYSICAGPDEDLRIAVKRVDAGQFSTFVNEKLRASDELEVMPPDGRFYTPLDPAHKKQYLLIAAGSGITPIIALVKSILLTEPQSRVMLLYSNKTRGDIIFRDALADLKNEFMDRLSVVYFFTREDLDSPLFQGRLDADKLRQILKTIVQPEQLDEVFICGPEAMMLELRQRLLDLGFNKKQIHIELFGTTKKDKHRKFRKANGEAQPVEALSLVKIKRDGATLEFRLHPDGESVLEAALEQGADLPFACKGGVCTTCRAMLEEGEVEMDVNYGLEPEEVAAGFILTCQSHPKTSTLVVNYDIR